MNLYEYFVVAPGFNMLTTSTVNTLEDFTKIVAEDLKTNGYFKFRTVDPNGGETHAILFASPHIIVMNKKGFENYKYEQARVQAAQGGRIIS